MEDNRDKQNRQRPASDRPKMPRSQRAKQFAPFDALDGLGAVLRQAEDEHRRMLENSNVVHTDLEE
ncbi:MAG: hypothetical protein E7219_08000 [Clostridiales bacterium]|jgi:hypothetical protein|nr:hypothetical protein [Clostridiales bacterium]